MNTLRQQHVLGGLLVVWMTICFSMWLTGCGGKENTYAPPPPPKVTIAKPVQQEITRFAEFTGTTKASAFVEIRARVEGYLDAIHFKPSMAVEKGTLLFEIDAGPYIAELHRSKADVAIREAEVRQAEATLTRKQQAFKSKAASEVEVIDAVAVMEKAKASLQAARATVEKAELQLSYTKIYSPVSGRIGRSLVDQGNLVGAAGEKTLLATIVNDRPIFAYFVISETELLAYNQKEKARKAVGGKPAYEKENFPVYLGLPSEAGYPHTGRLDYIENRINETTGTIEVRGVFDNADGTLLPGLFVRIRLPMGAAQTALLVPERALGTDQSGRYLLTVNAQNLVEQKPVTVGAAVGAMREIRSGIDSADDIVVNGILRARPGHAVTPVSDLSAPTKQKGGAS